MGWQGIVHQVGRGGTLFRGGAIDWLKANFINLCTAAARRYIVSTVHGTSYTHKGLQ